MQRRNFLKATLGAFAGGYIGWTKTVLARGFKGSDLIPYDFGTIADVPVKELLFPAGTSMGTSFELAPRLKDRETSEKFEPQHAVLLVLNYMSNTGDLYPVMQGPIPQQIHDSYVIAGSERFRSERKNKDGYHMPVMKNPPREHVQNALERKITTAQRIRKNFIKTRKDNLSIDASDLPELGKLCAYLIRREGDGAFGFHVDHRSDLRLVYSFVS